MAPKRGTQIPIPWSSIPKLDQDSLRQFAKFADELIYADFSARYRPKGNEVYWHNERSEEFLEFLADHNPSFTDERKKAYFEKSWAQPMAVIPDVLVHRDSEQSFYEMEPDIKERIEAGLNKLSSLESAFAQFELPYHPGSIFSPKRQPVGYFGQTLDLVLHVDRVAPGLFVYGLVLHVPNFDYQHYEHQAFMKLAREVVLLVVSESRPKFLPFNLASYFEQDPDLSDLAAAHDF